MSDQSWKKEFYPVAASRVAKKNALSHSLKKWVGALPSNLKRHSVDSPPIFFTDYTCSLCWCYNKKNKEKGMSRLDLCRGCPLYESRGRVSCDNHTEAEGDGCSPYDQWLSLRDPKPMIAALRKAIKWVAKGGTGR